MAAKADVGTFAAAGRIAPAIGGNFRVQRADERGQERLSPNFLSLCCLACGLFAKVKIVLIGELLLGEVLLIVLALGVLLFRGSGPRMIPSFALTLFGVGLAMFVGYGMSDLVVGTEPVQYLRGWARVFFTVAAGLAMVLVSSHGWRHLWWFVLGMTLASLATAGIDALSITRDWKAGYGAPLATLAAMATGFLPISLGAGLLGVFGLLSIILDYRSLGAVCMMIGATAFLHASGGKGVRWKSMLLTGLFALATGAAGIWAYGQGDKDVRERRTESDIGRYVPMIVAMDAIVEHPFIGYGSWASDREYAAKLRAAMAKANAGTDREASIGTVILPHSQLLSAWVEGGILGGLFFVFVGWKMIRAIVLLVLGVVEKRYAALFLLTLFQGLFGVIASPFAGDHRLAIAVCLAIISLVEFESAQAKRKSRGARA